MTSTPLLIWEETPEYSKAQAKGFEYIVGLNGANNTFYAAINFADSAGDKAGSQFYDCNNSRKEPLLEACQSHADSIAGAIADAVSEERKLSDDLATALASMSAFWSDGTDKIKRNALQAHAEART